MSAASAGDRGGRPASRPHPLYPPSLGAVSGRDGRTSFRVWAPRAERVEIEVLPGEPRRAAMHPADRGYFEVTLDDAPPGTRYWFVLNGDTSRPDPASRFQPLGVHEPSEVASTRFDWSDHGWAGLSLDDYILYELHVGTFTEAGTFDAAIEPLDELVALGITAVEVMPVAQFPGHRNWGYDGVHPFAVQNTYGGPEGLKRFVNACHARGLAVVLDVVYNHIGPEGNYLGEFGWYFTERHRTPWGAAINFDGPGSDEVRRFFIENALYWIRDCHVDALRLDAVHAIYDQSARPFLQELADAVRLQGELLGRRAYAIAESNLNDPRMVRAKELGGHGCDAQWVDDLHHALHTTLTGERAGYYADFNGFRHLAHSWQHGFVFEGDYSHFRGRRHGQPGRELPPRSFVVCAQNHDQVGNRMLGERLTALASFEQLKLAAGVVLLAPYVPLLFMGEEYGEPAPFLFFTSHGDPNLVDAVRKGRNEEFSTFRWQGEPPDPQDEHTFARSRPDRRLRHEGRHAALWTLHQRLIHLRKAQPALALLSREHMETFVSEQPPVVAARRWAEADVALALFHFGSERATVALPVASGRWTRVLDSADAAWQGPGSQLPEVIESSGQASLALEPWSFAVYRREQSPGE